MIDVDAVLALHAQTVAQWHSEPISNPYDGVMGIICTQHSFNYLLWHEEDIARSRDVSDAKIAEVKRNLDRYNPQRNDTIDKVDDWLMAYLASRTGGPASAAFSADAPINTETPGSAIDRLSIMSLRIYHLREQLDRTDVDQHHTESVRRKLELCGEQKRDLAASLSQLIADIGSGAKRHKIYRQFKMYNDPTLNPYLYSRGMKQAG